MKIRFLLGLTVVMGFMFFCSVNATAVELNNITIHGFVSQGYLKSNDNNVFAKTADGTYDFFESAISFSTEPLENLRVGVQLMSRDLGDSGNGALYMDLGYADYRWKDYIGFRIGLVEVPIGLYNKDRDIDFLRTSIFLPQSIYDENFRTFRSAYRGAGIYGNFDIGNAGDLEYEALVGTPELDKDEPLFQDQAREFVSSFVGTYENLNTEFNMDSAYAVALIWNTPVEGLRFGITQQNSVMNMIFAFDTNFDPFGDIQVYSDSEVDYDYFYVLSAEYTYDAFKIVGEYSRNKGVLESTAILTGAGIPGGSITMPANIEMTGENYYAMLTYRINDLLELGTYYSVMYPDVDNKDGAENYQKDWTVSARFDVLPAMTIKLETHFIDGTAAILNLLNSDGVEDNCVLYAAKCSVNF